MLEPCYWQVIILHEESMPCYNELLLPLCNFVYVILQHRFLISFEAQLQLNKKIIINSKITVLLY